MAAVLIIIALFGVKKNTKQTTSNEFGIPEIPQVTIRFSHAPYVDHTDGSIAIEKGWFKDVGITLADPTWNVTFDKIPSVLAAGTVDVASSNLYGLVPAMTKAKNLRMFAYGDLFIGFGIMGQPGMKTYREFRESGLSSEEALKKAVGQMIGKTIAVSPSPPDRAFLTDVLKMAGYDASDVNLVTVEDPVGIAMMESKRADFQMGGAPARSTLEAKGYIPVITNIDVVEQAPLGDTRGIHHNGWATTTDFWEKNRDTILRLASVKWRIMKFINEHPDEALEIHMPFLNKISGHKMSIETGRATYNSLDPFYTFEDQYGWFFDPNDKFNEIYPIRAAIKSFESSGVLPEGAVKEDEISITKEVYSEMLAFKEKSEQEMKKAELAIEKSNAKEKNVSQAQELLEKARFYHEIYDYLDAYRFAEACNRILNK